MLAVGYIHDVLIFISFPIQYDCTYWIFSIAFCNHKTVHLVYRYFTHGKGGMCFTHHGNGKSCRFFLKRNIVCENVFFSP